MARKNSYKRKSKFPLTKIKLLFILLGLAVLLTIGTLFLYQSNRVTPSLRVRGITSNDCTRTITSGRVEANDAQPGDIICIQNGAYSGIDIIGVQGTAADPITIINLGGQVVISGTGFCLDIQDSAHFRLTGTGSNDPFGFRIQGNCSQGVRLHMGSTDFEVDHIEVGPLPLVTGGIGFGAKTKADCGLYDENSITYNYHIHHNYIHDVTSEAYYIGSNNTVDASSGQGGSEQCGLNPVIEGLDFHNNLLDAFGKDGINVKGVVQDCNIYNNQIYRDSRILDPGQAGGIDPVLNSNCNVYNNLIRDGWGPGIKDQGRGNNKIYNNIIINPGQNGGMAGEGNGIFAGNSTPGAAGIEIYNNYIINPLNTPIDIKRSGSQIHDNIIVYTGSTPIKTSSGVTSTNNHVYQNVTQANINLNQLEANFLSSLQSSDPTPAPTQQAAQTTSTPNPTPNPTSTPQPNPTSPPTSTPTTSPLPSSSATPDPTPTPEPEPETIVESVIETVVEAVVETAQTVANAIVNFVSSIISGVNPIFKPRKPAQNIVTPDSSSSSTTPIAIGPTDVEIEVDENLEPEPTIEATVDNAQNPTTNPKTPKTTPKPAEEFSTDSPTRLSFLRALWLFFFSLLAKALSGFDS